MASKYTVELYDARAGADGRHALISRYVLSGAADAEDAQKRALDRARSERRSVVSVNLRPNKDQSSPEAVMLYVQR